MPKKQNNYPHSHNSHEAGDHLSRKEKALVIGMIAGTALVGADTADKVASHYETGKEVSASINPVSWLSAPIAEGTIAAYDAIHPDNVTDTRELPEGARHIVINEDAASSGGLRIDVRRDEG